MPEHETFYRSNDILLTISPGHTNEFFYFLKTFFLWRCGPTRAMVYFLSLLEYTKNDVQQSVGLLWTSDQLVGETSTWQHTALLTDIHEPGGIGTHNLSRWAAADLRRSSRGQWNRLLYT